MTGPAEQTRPPPHGDWLDRAEELLARARAGENVVAGIASLPPELAQQITVVMETEALLLGGTAPIIPIRATVAPTTPGAGMALLEDRYEIKAELGRGGMGVVFAALDRKLDRQVVVKFMAADKAWNPRLRRRFQREGEALMKIRGHPNLVQVHRVNTEGGQPYIVMEYVQGVSLLGLMQQRRRLPWQEAARYAAEAARGLAVVHRHGILHRDVKPENVVVAQDGHAKLLDFGLAKDVFRSTLTQSGAVLGTSYYMAPEQWGEGEEKPDPRCDVFSLGATLYHLLVGEPPFVGEDLGEIMDLIMVGDYDPPRELVEEIPEELELVVTKMLMPDRRFRYYRMDDCADDLERVLRGERSWVQSLVDARERRFPLLPGRRFTLGREDSCDVTLPDPTVSREHAQIRREDGAFTLRDLGSSYGTFVEDRKLESAHVLRDGDKVRLGDVVITFHDPDSRPRPAAYLEDIQRQTRPDPLLRELVAVRDPRVLLQLLEDLTPQPWREEQDRLALAALLGEETAQAVEQRWAHRIGEARAALPGVLSAISGVEQPDPEAWLSWWDHARSRFPDQIGVWGATETLQLRVLEGEEQPTQADLSEGVLLVGRDPRCHLRLKNPTVARLHATVFRMHRRCYVRHEGSRAETKVDGVTTRLALLDPGGVLELGDVRLGCEVAEPGAGLPPVGLGMHGIDPLRYEALVELRHPAVISGLVGSLYELTRLEWVDATAAELFGDAARAFAQRVRALLTERAAGAKRVLPELLGQDAGDDAARWNQLLAQRRAQLPPQVVPWGWLAATRQVDS